jgi:predicted kinase
VGGGTGTGGFDLWHGAKLILPIGPPGAGKSRLAQLFVQAGIFDHHAIVSPDHFRHVLTGNRGDQSMNEVAFGFCHRIVRERMVRHLPVYFDSTNIRANWRKDVVEAAQVNQVPIVSILFRYTDDEMARKNNDTDWRREHGQVVPDDVMSMMLERHLALTAADLPGTVLYAENVETVLRVAIQGVTAQPYLGEA